MLNQSINILYIYIYMYELVILSISSIIKCLCCSLFLWSITHSGRMSVKLLININGFDIVLTVQTNLSLQRDARRGAPWVGGRPPRGPVGGGRPPRGLGGIDWVGTHPTDYTKPRNIRQSFRNIIQSLEY